MLDLIIIYSFNSLYIIKVGNRDSKMKSLIIQKFWKSKILEWVYKYVSIIFIFKEFLIILDAWKFRFTCALITTQSPSSAWTAQTNTFLWISLSTTRSQPLTTLPRFVSKQMNTETVCLISSNSTLLPKTCRY